MMLCKMYPPAWDMASFRVSICQISGGVIQQYSCFMFFSCVPWSKVAKYREWSSHLSKNNPSKKYISTNTVGLMTIPYHTEAVGLDRPCQISSGLELVQINHGLGPPNREAAVVIHLAWYLSCLTPPVGAL